MKYLLLSAVLSLASLSAFGWANKGHRIVGRIAENHLSAATKAKLAPLLGRDRLADVANWADSIKSDPNWAHASPWHYVTIEDGQDYHNSNRSPKGDVIESITRFSAILGNKSASNEERAEALRFLVHFVGDVHNPLHVGKGADQGGNLIPLSWFIYQSNLHEIWDEHIIEAENLSYTEYVEWIDRALPEEIENYQTLDLDVWVAEAMALRPLVYSYPAQVNRYWEYEYRYRTTAVINEQLLKAGLRLAYLIERSL